MAQKTKYKEFLIKMNISQVTVSKQTGLTKPILNLIVNGYSNMTLNTLKKLCKFHQCSPNDIIDWEGWVKK